jgi:S1-C subfamily serine protease
MDAITSFAKGIFGGEEAEGASQGKADSTAKVEEAYPVGVDDSATVVPTRIITFNKPTAPTQVGITVANAPASEGGALEEGAQVQKIFAGSIAEQAGLKEGDLVRHVNQTRVRTHDEFARIIGAAVGTVTLEVS